MTPDEKRRAIAPFQHVDLAFCRIFGQQDQLDTAISVRLGTLPVCAEIPKAHAESIAAEVTLDLACIAIGSRE
jgi:hypothetical protein